MTSSLGWALLVTLVVLFAAAAAWGVAVDVPVTAKGRGILLAQEGVIDVTAHGGGGQVAKVLVGRGDRVAMGDVVVILMGHDSIAQIALHEARLEEARASLDRVQSHNERAEEVSNESLRVRRAAADQQIALLGQRLAWLRERQSGLDDLSSKKLMANSIVLENRIQLTQAAEELARAQSELQVIAADETLHTIEREREARAKVEQVNRIEAELEALKQQYAMRAQIRSPAHGVVTEIKTEIGDHISSGDAVLGLSRLQTEEGVDHGGGLHLIGVSYVNAFDGKRVRERTPVLLFPTSIERSERRYIQGVVRDVARLPSTRAAIATRLRNDQLIEILTEDGATLEVTIELLLDPNSPDGLSWSTPPPAGSVPPEAGTILDVQFMIEEQRLIAVAIPFLKRFFPSAPPRMYREEDLASGMATAKAPGPVAAGATVETPR